jgi:UDP-N-acetylglucosamine 2-epimerase (non-hydrolysing)
MKLTILSVIGTRPEAVKMAPVIKALEQHTDRIRSVVCATGQHREMLDQALRLFDIKPDYDLNVMQPGQRLSQLTARLIDSLDALYEEVKPDWVLVQGDTTTVMTASLTAYYHRIKIGHVEAGLRTGKKFQPFPEEANRRIADVLADLYFAPTQTSRGNLLREGIAPERILVTGNTVIDALLMVAQRVRDRSLAPLIGSIDGKRLILVTSHRRENFGDPFQNICRALAAIAARHRDDVHIVYPVHFNPNVHDPAHTLLSGAPNITLIQPVDYETIVTLMNQAYLILTDSGGLQEEAPTLHKPVLVLREVTERPEVIQVGAAKLVGSDVEKIVSETERLLSDPIEYGRMSSAPNPFGDGHASERIVETLLNYTD